MSHRRSQRPQPPKDPADVLKEFALPSPAPQTPVPATEKTTITATGTLFDGTKKSQDLLIRFRPGQSIGEIIWTAVEVFKRVGGLTEDVEGGIIFYPAQVFEGGVRFAEKLMLTADASKTS